MTWKNSILIVERSWCNYIIATKNDYVFQIQVALIKYPYSDTAIESVRAPTVHYIDITHPQFCVPVLITEQCYIAYLMGYFLNSV